jgi:peptidoglycan hydrolase CwlO-like protein
MVVSPTLFVPILVAAIAAVGAYFAAIRKLSGTVATSQADDLWEESRSIRQDYQRRIEELNKVIFSMQSRIDSLEKKNEELHAENGALQRSLESQEETIKHLHQTIGRLETENTEQRQENLRLRSRLKELEMFNETEVKNEK